MLLLVRDGTVDDLAFAHGVRRHDGLRGRLHLERVPGFETFRDLALDRLTLGLDVDRVARADALGHGHLHELRDEGHLAKYSDVLVYVVFAWVWVAGLILNIIVVTIFFFANRHEFSWVEGSFTAWYIAFMVWSLILLVVRVYIAGFVHKFFNALQSVGDDRAKELGEHSNYDQKCVVIP